MRSRIAVAALLLVATGVLLAVPSAQAGGHCPADSSSSAQLVSSEYATTRRNTFSTTNTGSGNATFDGAYASASSTYISASASASHAEGSTVEPGESVSVTVSVEIEPSASETTHTVDVDLYWSGQSDCRASWSVTVVKNPIGSFAMDGSSATHDLDETFKGDTPDEGNEITGLQGEVEETTGFDGIGISDHETDCGDLSEWMDLSISGWPSHVSAGDSASFSMALSIDADTPYEFRGERFDCDIDATYTADDDGQQGDLRGSVKGELLWPATLGAVEVEHVNVTFDEPRERPPQTFTTSTDVTVKNIGDEPMTLPAGTHALDKGAQLELLEAAELEPVDTGGNPETVELPARLHLSADMDGGHQELTGYVTTDEAGDGPVATAIQVHQPIGLRVDPDTVTLAGDEGVPIGDLHELPFRAYETYGYRNVTDAELTITGEAPEAADERGDGEWLPRRFGPTTIAAGQPWNPKGRDLGTALQFLPGAKPGCTYGYTLELDGEDVDPVTLELVVEARQRDRQTILDDLDGVVGQAGEEGSAVNQHLGEALASVEIDPEEACQADLATVADNQRLLVAAGSAVTFFEDGVDAAAAADTVDVEANRLATAATALETIRQQRASMQTTGTAVSELDAAIGVLEDRLRTALAATAEDVYCEIGSCEGELGPYLSAAQMLPEVAAIAGFEDLESEYREGSEAFREEHRNLVTEAYERYQEADRSADEARRSHLVRVGDGYWLVNPLRYGFYVATTDEAVEDLQRSAEAFEQLGDGVMATASENRATEIQSAQSAAQNSFFLVSFVYLGLFGVLVTHLVRSTMHYRRDASEAADGSFLRVTEAEPIAAGAAGGLGDAGIGAGGGAEPVPEPAAPEADAAAGAATTETEGSPEPPKGPFTDGEPEVVRLDE
jgi:hypothetical protein